VFVTIAAIVPAMSLPTASAALGASSIVECGQLVAYTAPDPVAPSTGSLTIGLLSPWTIAADAALSPATASSLPGITGSGPSCLALDLDDTGVVTGMDFAATGTVHGAVAFDSGFGGYVFANRLLVPTFITDLYPGLEATFATSHAAGTNATATFAVDTTTGQFTDVDARAAFCGPGRLDSNGNGRIGHAVIDGSLLTPAEKHALADADSRHACVAVRTVGTIDSGTGQLSLTTNVTLKIAPAASVAVPAIGTAPPTDTSRIQGARSGQPSTATFLVAGLIGFAAIAVARHSASRRSGRQSRR
jgi:hypothetical protein